jgi:hypothetical protein
MVPKALKNKGDLILDKKSPHRSGQKKHMGIAYKYFRYAFKDHKHI